MKMKKTGIVLVSVFVICLGAFLISGLSGDRTLSVLRTPQEDILTMPIKNYDEYIEVCSEENVLKAKENVPPDLKEMFGKKEFKELFLSFAAVYVDYMPTSALYNEKGCYLSACGISYFNAAANGGSEARQCFIFTRDMKEAGVIRFTGDGFEGMSVSVNDSENGGSSVILERLAESRDSSFIIIANGMDIMLLDGENNLASAGRRGHSLEIDGNVFGALEEKGYSVSYSGIVSEDNLVWVEFGEQ